LLKKCIDDQIFETAMMKKILLEDDFSVWERRFLFCFEKDSGYTMLS
jgi:hypothetical protein